MLKKIKILLLIGVVIYCANSVQASVVETQNKMEYLNLQWWQKYNDSILDEYLVQIYEKNHDLKIADLRVKQSQQIVRQSLGAELPQIGFAGNLNRTFSNSIVQFGDLVIPDYSQSNFLLPLTMNYEIDIWQINRMKTKSVQKQLEIMKQGERATYIALMSAFVSDYYNLVKLDKMLEYQGEIVKIQREVMKLTSSKYKNGLARASDLIYEEKKMSLFEEEFIELKKRQDIIINQLIAYLELPDDEVIKRISYDKITLIEPPTSISTESIKYRPDFIIAQEHIKRLGLDVKIAQRNFLPRFILSGQVGFNAYNLSKIFTNGTFLSSAGIIPVLDVFTGGQKMAYLKFKKYEYQEMTQKYEKAILTSIQELNDSLIIAKAANENYKKSLEREKLENDNFILIAHKYEIGATSNLDRLKAKEDLLIAEKNEISNKINFLISSIGIYKAVGGQDFTTIEGL